jgi:hypothetical protein
MNAWAFACVLYVCVCVCERESMRAGLMIVSNPALYAASWLVPRPRMLTVKAV